MVRVTVLPAMEVSLLAVTRPPELFSTVMLYAGTLTISKGISPDQEVQEVPTNAPGFVWYELALTWT